MSLRQRHTWLQLRLYSTPAPSLDFNVEGSLSGEAWEHGTRGYIALASLHQTVTGLFDVVLCPKAHQPNIKFKLRTNNHLGAGAQGRPPQHPPKKGRW